ncbi:MAG: glycosyltransferase [Planctomycetaceae bacterium]|nr:glycosyltransferase [Planctomycetaceae bacterium]
MQKKIVFIIPTLDQCGAEKQMTLLAVHLPKDEFEVHVIALTRSGPYAEQLEAANIPLTLIGKLLKIDPLAYLRLKNAIRRIQPDIVHTWLFAANSYGRQAALSCKVPHIIAGERCVDPWKSPLHFAVDRHLAKYSVCIITNSTGVRDFYTQHGLSADKFEIVPNAVVPPKNCKPYTIEKIFSELGTNPEEPGGNYHPVRSTEYLPEERTYRTVSNTDASRQRPFIIGVVARLWAQKRIQDILWAFESLQSINFNFHAFIIGDGPERETLLRMRDNWCLNHCVHFLGERNDVNRIMPCFDVLLNCSGYEGQSNSILEAMSLGIPVIATDIAGNKDLVIDGETGILTPDGGSDFRLRRRTLVKKTLHLLENEDLRKEMGSNAIKRVAEHFSLEAMIQRHVEIYRKCFR